MTLPIPACHSLSINQPKTFSTERFPLAIFLHASQRLSFLCCEATEGGKIRFVFEDSRDSGSQTELEYERGAEVSATALFASQKYLRRKMSEILNNRRIENPQNESHH